MVFYYAIRGGQCLNDSKHITLSSDDIICYVGRDKHENEHLIKYGWPGDIWYVLHRQWPSYLLPKCRFLTTFAPLILILLFGRFHVEGLSSAHVYFRLRNTDTVSSIPVDDLPPDSVYDMMQICKNNSIAGCKLSSCKMVYTPHSNLKKTFDMESGAVTYHNTKLCRYQRCDKDRQRVKELEKTKSKDIDVNYYEEMKANERRIIERKKRQRKGGDGLYDPLQEDIKSTQQKATRQGDKESGLDSGLAALEGLSFAPVSKSAAQPEETDGGMDDAAEPDEPQWVQDEQSRALEPSDDVRFLRERGYPAKEAAVACNSNKSRVSALRKLYNPECVDASSSDIPEEVTVARQEEKEVLLAMFGEDETATFGDIDNENSLDVVLPITAYEPPDRYEVPPPLMLEVYVDNDIAPRYPSEPPVLALVGGGFSEEHLRELTDRVKAEATEKAADEPGEPQIFNLLTFVGEAAEQIVEEETAELEAAKKKRLEEQREAAAKQREAEAEKRKKDPASVGSAAFANDAERRAYAKDVVAAGAYSKPGGGNDGAKKNAPRKKYDTGVSDQSLINDLFG